MEEINRSYKNKNNELSSQDIRERVINQLIKFPSTLENDKFKLRREFKIIRNNKHDIPRLADIQ